MSKKELTRLEIVQRVIGKVSKLRGRALVGALSEILSALLDAGLSDSSMPKALPAMLVALISASPEILTALRTAQNNRMQTTVNNEGMGAQYGKIQELSLALA